MNELVHARNLRSGDHIIDYGPFKWNQDKLEDMKEGAEPIGKVHQVNREFWDTEIAVIGIKRDNFILEMNSCDKLLVRRESKEKPLGTIF